PRFFSVFSTAPTPPQLYPLSLHDALPISLPGPLIRAKVGDRIVVRFRNSLPEPTSIHWHGMRLPNDMDGVPGLTQPPIEPGSELDRKSTRLNSSHVKISYAVFCLKKKKRT